MALTSNVTSMLLEQSVSSCEEHLNRLSVDAAIADADDDAELAVYRRELFNDLQRMRSCDKATASIYDLQGTASHDMACKVVGADQLVSDGEDYACDFRDMQDNMPVVLAACLCVPEGACAEGQIPFQCKEHLEAFCRAMAPLNLPVLLASNADSTQVRSLVKAAAPAMDVDIVHISGASTQWLNALLSAAKSASARVIVFVALELRCSAAVIKRLSSRVQMMGQETLVAGAALGHHAMLSGVVPLTVRTAPSMAASAWSVPLLSRTGFPMGSEGLPAAISEGHDFPGGIESLLAIALQQRFVGQNSTRPSAVLVHFPTEWVARPAVAMDSPGWHKRALASKTQAWQRHLELMGLSDTPGCVLHEHVPPPTTDGEKLWLRTLGRGSEEDLWMEQVAVTASARRPCIAPNAWPASAQLPELLHQSSAWAGLR